MSYCSICLLSIQRTACIIAWCYTCVHAASLEVQVALIHDCEPKFDEQIKDMYTYDVVVFVCAFVFVFDSTTLDHVES